MVPGIIAVVVTYIGEEWPPERIALIMSFYVSGTALGGFMGRISAGMLADHFSWRVSFLALGAASLAGAAVVAAWLPHGRRRAQHLQSDRPSFVAQVRALFRNRRLVATFAVGFNVLFSLVGVFTWITFYLSAAPFFLSITALSSLFFVYLIGLVVTPAAGYLITRVGLRTGISGAIVCSMVGVGLTLAHSLTLVIVGLAALSSGVFIAQTASQSHLRIAAPPGARRYGGGSIFHLLLPGRYRCGCGSRCVLGAGKMACVRGVHRVDANDWLGNRTDWVADSGAGIGAKCRIMKMA